jgi:MoaA/NifB/PqqE/SkfB family radical SAM enzyme
MQTNDIIKKNKQIFLKAYEMGKKKVSYNYFHKIFRRNQIFLNITKNCSLNCSHCAVNAGLGFTDIPYERMLSIIYSLMKLRYEIVSLNGGEPFMFNDFSVFIKQMSKIYHPDTEFWLNTNLICEMDNEIILDILHAFNHIIVSIDGDENEHDHRRGKGNFKKTYSNLQCLIREQTKCKISIRATLTPDQYRRGINNDVKNIAKELGIKNIFFSNVLPIGRAKNIIKFDKLLCAIDNGSYFTRQFFPRNNCGIGSNLHITSAGDVYPCWALIESKNKLGNISYGLNKIINNYN